LIQGDLPLVRHFYLKTLYVNCLVIFPIMLAIILFAPTLAVRFLGGEWSGMSLALQALAVGVMFHAAGGTTSTVYKAVGRPGLDLALFALTSVVFLLPALIVGALVAGISGAAIAVAANKAVSVVIRQIFLDRLIGGVTEHVVVVLARVLLLQLPIVALALAARLLFPEGGWERDLVTAIISAIVYLPIMFSHVREARSR